MSSRKYVGLIKNELDYMVRKNTKITHYSGITGTIKNKTGCHSYPTGMGICDNLWVILPDNYFCCFTSELGVPKVCPLKNNRKLKIDVSITDDNIIHITNIVNGEIKLITEYII